MKNLLFIILLISCSQNQIQNTETEILVNQNLDIITGKVISVKDGDSIELLDSKNEIHQIRLAHVDCPEKKQPFGIKAKVFTANFCFGKIVKASIETLDRYGRKVCVVNVDDKELNLEIIKAGYGWHFKKYSKSEIHASAELESRKLKNGLWSKSNPVAPWNYRKRK